MYCCVVKYKCIKYVRNSRNEEYDLDISYDYWIFLQVQRKYPGSTLFGEYFEDIFVFYHRVSAWIR